MKASIYATRTPFLHLAVELWHIGMSKGDKLPFEHPEDIPAELALRIALVWWRVTFSLTF